MGVTRPETVSGSVGSMREVSVPMGSPSAPKRAIHLSEEVALGLEARRKGSSFPDLDAYVEFVLARLLDHPSNEPFSEEDERRLRERLRSLGYID